MISDSLVTEIESANDRMARELLFAHLHCHADVSALREYCRIAMTADAFPKMQHLGEKMLRDLPPEGLLGLVVSCSVCVCVCACVRACVRACVWVCGWVCGWVYMCG